MSKKPSWSFSSLKTFDQCPKKYYHTKVLKDFEEDFNTEPILYGNEFHLAAEEYVGGVSKKLDKRFSYAKNLLDRLKNMPGKKLPEYEFALTSNLEPCEFSSKDAWYRGIADLIILDKEKKVAKVFDYKTGKSARYADKGQLELMALNTFRHFPEVEMVKSGLLFVVCNVVIKEDYSKEDETRLWRKWLTNYANLTKSFETDVWNPKPTGLCKAHCVVETCPHNGRR